MIFDDTDLTWKIFHNESKPKSWLSLFELGVARVMEGNSLPRVWQAPLVTVTTCPAVVTPQSGGEVAKACETHVVTYPIYVLLLTSSAWRLEFAVPHVTKFSKPDLNVFI